MILPFLYVADAGASGRGVFSSEDIAAGTLIEVSPVIVMSGEDRKHLDQTLLHDYIFEWGHDQQQCCMALGYVPLYNHSSSSNCEYEMDFDHALIGIRTVRDIKAGDELCINYNGDWNDEKPVWFEISVDRLRPPERSEGG
ncbi:MAG: SET domain-containing protein-lysine N-methyltransferase [Chitinophagaceae bacterium]|nr:SET domain-containing protein-lysine N-methyltransferase [Chitinophagaceae bacterium]